jgi:hypothetical protein
MSRDKRGNRTQEVDGSSPFSSTNPSHQFARIRPEAAVILATGPRSQ